jgi:hypothetical protein
MGRHVLDDRSSQGHHENRVSTRMKIAVVGRDYDDRPGTFACRVRRETGKPDLTPTDDF